MLSVNCPFCDARNHVGGDGLNRILRCSCGARYFLEPAYDSSEGGPIPGDGRWGQERTVPGWKRTGQRITSCSIRNGGTVLLAG